MTSLQVLLDLLTSAVGLAFSFYYRAYYLARDFRKIWAYSLLLKFGLGLFFLVPLVTPIGQNTASCAAWYTAYDVATSAVAVFYSEISTLLLLALCHDARGGLLYVLVNDIIDIASKYTSIESTGLNALFNVTSDQMKAGHYEPYLKLCATCLPFLLLPILLTPLIPRTREEFHAMPAHLKGQPPKQLGGALSWLVRRAHGLSEHCWPDALARRDFHPASSALLLWWIGGFCYSWYVSFTDMWGGTSDAAARLAIAVVVWAVVCPGLLLAFFSKCGGGCGHARFPEPVRTD